MKPFLLASVIILFASTSAAQVIKVRTARGVDIDVALSIPAGTGGRAPAVVIAPGQGYHMDLPIVANLAKAVSDNGFVAVRFNWAYFTATPQGAPSPDLLRETEDLQAVLDFVKADSRVDPSQVVIAGKSLGSLVAYRAFVNNPAAKALVLLTPVCSQAVDDGGRALPAPVSTAAQSYPRFSELTRPVVLILGNADPLCSVPVLYDFLKGTKGNAVQVVVGGDHGWNVTSDTDAAARDRNARNVAAGVGIAAHWINLVLGR